MSGILLSGNREARADMGPKPSIEVTVVNAPEDYYLALLCDEKYDLDRNRFNISSLLVIDFMCEFEQDGWYVFGGMTYPIAYPSNKKGIYHYTYDVPDPFRVLIVDMENNVYVSPVLDQKGFNARCTYDVAAGTLTEQLSLDAAAEEDSPTVIISWKYVLFCLIMTLLIELVIYVFFRFPFTKRNMLCFVAINTITNLSYSYYTVNSVSSWNFVLRCIVFEIGIAVVEAVFYAFMLRDAKGRRCAEKSFGYGVAANFVSAAAGVIGMMIYAFVKRMFIL